MTQDGFRTRMKALAAVVAILFAALFTRLWFLQVLAAEQYQEDAETNRVRLVPIPAPRGRVLDRDGELLVRNRASVVVTVDRLAVENEEDLLFRLSKVLRVPARRLASELHDPRYLSYQPVPVLLDAPEDAVAYLAEHSSEFPGVSYDTVAVRDYPRGALGAHLLGYLGEISPAELEDPRFDGYRPGDRVGRGGVERYYEQFLHGNDGWTKLQVNSQGKIIDDLGSQAPRAGYDVVLSIDREVQALAETSLQEGIGAAHTIYDDESKKFLKAPAGAVVVLDPKTGKIVALASYPSYDPRIFLGGLSEKEWRKLNDPLASYPLNNRALQGLYPPGSTFKPFVAAAAIKAGYATPYGYYDCPGDYVAPGDTSGTVFHNWKPTDSGRISLARALIDSCDTVFYQFGWQFNRDRETRDEIFQRLMRKWGFGSPTGVDLPAESEGRVPDIAWKEEVHERAPLLFPEGLWLPGDNINMAIGQGDLLSTPLQLAAAYAGIANGGTIFRPQVGLRIQTPTGDLVQEVDPHVAGRVAADKPALDLIREALRQVPIAGTARSAFLGFPLSQVPVAGKTGTAEIFGKQPHSWFAAFAPVADPEYVVVAIVEEGGHGSEVAAPIVRRIFEGLFGLTPSEIRPGDRTD